MIKNFVTSPSIAMLAAANTIPLFGVVFFGWDLFAIVFGYWFENVLIGGVQIIKLAIVGKKQAFILVPFFVVHYGIFLSAHLLFILGIFKSWNFVTGSDLAGVVSLFRSYGDILTAMVLSFGLSHGFSLIYNFLIRKEYKKTSPTAELLAPYHRIIVMHLTILLGGFVALLFNSPKLVLVIMIIIKTIFDMNAHKKVHELKMLDVF